MTKPSISSANESFWNELCGTHLAKVIGISDSSAASLKKFDDWYFNFYPYLFDHIPFDELKNKDVLEVGLGYGTVSQRLAESGANYQGLDIAAGPVNMVNHRLRQNGLLPDRAHQGSILEPTFKPNSFDAIIAIGCLHHTGDLKKAIDQCYSLLREGGELTFMVYYAYSYRRWTRSPLATLSYVLRESKGYRGVVGLSASRDRAAYDSNSSGEGAPHTDWISKKSLSEYCSLFSSFTPTIENIDRDNPLFILWKRKTLLSTCIPSKMGLDLYMRAKK
jgi:2-polyprenyl-3-methyl-5-hydroxy-6-metoxy-1,4-benzoquinol methylase